LKQAESVHGQEFQYIVIGAGSAGCALARYLSDDPDSSVLVVEAGGRDLHPDIHEPNQWINLLGSEVDWSYETTSQAATAGRTHAWPRGRVLGGTSSINGMMYLRGDHEDFDNWAYMGNIGWDYKSVLESFKEIETVTDLDPEFHGQTGPLHPAPLTVHPRFSEAFRAGAVEAGFSPNPDFNGRRLEGVGWNQLTIHEGQRESALRAFLRPVLSRNNLTVLTESLIEQVVVSNGRAVGVRVSRQDGRWDIAASREVILCAGAIESPAVLMRSGIGPAAELEGMEIAVVCDLPGVGRNLTDHMMVHVVYETSAEMEVDNQAITDCVLFAKSNPNRLTCDLQLSPYRSPKDGFTLLVENMRPHSRGFVRLRSTDPTVPPMIDPKYLSEWVDVDTLAAGVATARVIANSEALSEWPHIEVSPGPQVASEAQLKGYVRRNASTSFHPAGTCRMGVESDCVVDPELRVHGLEGLRVADASIMPAIVGANTNASSMMIGWHAGKLIRDSISGALRADVVTPSKKRQILVR
jgi:choline dehydrogenase